MNAVQGRRNWDNSGGICYPSQYLADMLSNHIPIRQTDSALVCTPSFEGLPPALLSCMVFRHGTHMNKEGNVMIRDWHSRTNSRHYTETPCTEAKPSPPPTKSQKRRNRENPKICNKWSKHRHSYFSYDFYMYIYITYFDSIQLHNRVTSTLQYEL